MIITCSIKLWSVVAVGDHREAIGDVFCFVFVKLGILSGAQFHCGDTFFLGVVERDRKGSFITTICNHATVSKIYHHSSAAL
jgi:hypothetical protein